MKNATRTLSMALLISIAMTNHMSQCVDPILVPLAAYGGWKLLKRGYYWISGTQSATKQQAENLKNEVASLQETVDAEKKEKETLKKELTIKELDAQQHRSEITQKQLEINLYEQKLQFAKEKIQTLKDQLREEDKDMRKIYFECVKKLGASSCPRIPKSLVAETEDDSDETTNDDQPTH